MPPHAAVAIPFLRHQGKLQASAMRPCRQDLPHRQPSRRSKQLRIFGNLVAWAGSYNRYMSGSAPNHFAGDMQLRQDDGGGDDRARTISKMQGQSISAAAANVACRHKFSRHNQQHHRCHRRHKRRATMKSVQAVVAAGSFTLYKQAATAETRVNFL